MVEQLKFKIYEDALLNPLRGHALNELESYIASLLLTTNTHRPIGIAEIISAVKDCLDVKLSERTVKKIIRTLRKDHTFPILARRTKPTGYWWCASSDEMKAFIESFRHKLSMNSIHCRKSCATTIRPYRVN